MTPVPATVQTRVWRHGASGTRFADRQVVEQLGFRSQGESHPSLLGRVGRVLRAAALWHVEPQCLGRRLDVGEPRPEEGTKALSPKKPRRMVRFQARTWVFHY